MIWPVLLPAVASLALVVVSVALTLRPSPPLKWRELTFAEDLDIDRVVGLLRHAVAIREGPVSVVVVGAERRVRFFVGAPAQALSSIVAAGAGLIATSRLDDTTAKELAAPEPAVIGARVGWDGRWPVLSSHAPQISAAGLLGVLASAGRGERLQLWVRLWPAPRVERPIATAERSQHTELSWLRRAWAVTPPPREDMRVIRAKYSDLLARVEVLVVSGADVAAVASGNAQRLVAALRTAGGVRGVLRYSLLNGGRLQRFVSRRRMPLPWERTTLMSAQELAGIVGWPINTPAVAGVSYGAGPRFAPPVSLPKHGRLIALSNFPATNNEPLRQPIVGGLQHALVAGPTGSGKSTLVCSLVAQDMLAGRGAFVLDLKGDLISDLLCRVPDSRVGDVVVLEPAVGGCQPGLKLFDRGSDVELTSDLILGTLSEMFSDSWGIRSSQYLGLGLRTLAAAPGSTLVDLPALFTQERFRAKVLSGVKDPWLRAAWQRFLALSDSDRAVHVASPLTKLEELVGRGRLRLVLGQCNSKLDFDQVLERRQIVLVSLPPGLLGGPATRLLAALTLWQFFQAVEARARLEPNKRVPFFAYVDEVAVLRDLPLPLESILERARGHGVGLLLAPQALSQLSPSLRASLLANVGSLIAFGQTSVEEARTISSALPGVSVSQLQHLGRFEVVMRLSLGPGDLTSTMTGTTLPATAKSSEPAAIRQCSGERYGQTLEQIDRELMIRHGLGDDTLPNVDEVGTRQLGVRRRRP